MENASVVNAGARLDRLPISRFHYRMLWLIGAGALMDAFDLYLAGGVMAKMVEDGFSTVAANASFLSAGFFGMLVGAGFAGYFGDRFGRRYSYQTNLLIFGLASLAGAFAPSIGVLTALRFVMGLGLGAEIVVASGTLCEFVPPSHRGRWISLLVIIVNLGFLASTIISYFVIPALGWRWMFGIAAVGALAVWVARKGMPESPRWLESVGKSKEAERTLRQIEASVEVQHGPLPPVNRIDDVKTAPVSIAALFAPDMLARTVVASLIVVATLVTIFSFVAWLPTFMVKEGFSVVKSLGFSTLMSFGGPLGGILGFCLSDRMPRRRSIVSVCALVIALGLLYPTVHQSAAIVGMGFALVTAIYTLVALGMYTYVPELFPTALRLRGTGFASVCGRGASIVSPYLVVLVFSRFGLSGVLMAVVGLLALLIIAVLAIGVETASSSLENISEMAVGPSPSVVTSE